MDELNCLNLSESGLNLDYGNNSLYYLLKWIKLLLQRMRTHFQTNPLTFYRNILI